jgi:hypothetical protein
MARTLNLRELVSITCTAGVWGSVAGTALFILYWVVTGSSGDFMILMLFPFIFMIGVAATVPVAVVAGVATIWPVRKWVEQTPLLVIIPVSIGGCLGYFASSRLLMTWKPAAAEGAWIIGLFGTTTAISLIVGIWRAMRRSDGDPTENFADEAL